MNARHAARLLMIAAVAAIAVFSLAPVAFGQTPDSTSSSSSTAATPSTAVPSPVSTGPGLPPGPTIVESVTITPPVTPGTDVVLSASVTSPAVVPDPVCPEGSTPVFFSPQPSDWYCHRNTPPSTDVDPATVVLPATGFPTGWVLLSAAILSAFGLGLIAAGRPGAPARPRRCHR